MKVAILIIKLLLLGALFIISNNELYLSDSVDRADFYEQYFSWLNTIFSQSVDLTAYVIKFEWLPESSTYKV